MEQVTDHLTANWRAHGHAVTIFTTPLPRESGTTVQGTIVELPGKSGRYTHVWGRRVASQDFSRFDVVMGVSSAARALLGRADLPPVVMQAHGTSLEILRSKARRPQLRSLAGAPRNALWLVRDLRDNARYDAVVGVGPTVTRSMDSYPRQYRARRYAEIPNGVSPSLASPLPNSGRRGALFVGRLHPQKGVQDAINALKGNDISLTICGDGPAQVDLKNLARQLGVSERVRFAGRVDSEMVRQHMRTARVLVVPSIGAEGLPLVVLEALMEGTPVAASASVVAGLGSVTPPGVFAVDLKRDSLKEVAKTASAMPPGEISRHAAERYSLESMADAYLALFRDLARASDRRLQ
jgi:glycosyltransferase involved in cell wall biosynthesis